MSEKSRSPFTSNKDKVKNNKQLAKDVLLYYAAGFQPNAERVALINENWHLKEGVWPEMDTILANKDYVMRVVTEDGDTESAMSLSNGANIGHYPKINTITRNLIDTVAAPPLVAIAKDYSMYGRKYREEKTVEAIKEHYYNTLFKPREDAVKSQYLQENNIQDVFSLSPEEQNQVENDLRKRIKEAIPKSMMEDLKKIRTPDEKIKQVLINNDRREYGMDNMLREGAEMAIMSNSEYYKIGKNGNKPTIELLDSKYVTWIGSSSTLYSHKGSMAKHTRYLTPHEVIKKYGREVMSNKKFIAELSGKFDEIPGYSGWNHNHGDSSSGLFVNLEYDFLDMIDRNPNLIQNDWRTQAGQDDIKNVYRLLSQSWQPGYGIREDYVTWKWTEMIKQVIRREADGTFKEYYLGDWYVFSPEKGDVEIRNFPINKVWHGTVLGNDLIVGLEAVDWVYHKWEDIFDPNLTIVGTNYGKSIGYESTKTIICPAKRYQLSYNIAKSKNEEIEAAETGPISMFNLGMRPQGWSEEDYAKMIFSSKRVPFSTERNSRDVGGAPVIQTNHSSSEIDRREARLDRIEREMYESVGLNKDAMGQSSQYASNALAQNNIAGANKQMSQLLERRRNLKEQLLDFFCSHSMICLLDDPEKQSVLLDDFSRVHVTVNEEQIRGNVTNVFIVEDYEEAALQKEIRMHVLAMLQNGYSIKDIIAVLKSKSTAEMEEIAEISEMNRQEIEARNNEVAAEQMKIQSDIKMAVEQMKQDMENLRAENKNKANIQMAELNSKTMLYAADVDGDNKSDALTRAEMEIKSREKIEMEKLAVQREKIANEKKKS